MSTHPVSYEKIISSSKKELWELISSPEHLNLVHPFCKSNESIEWDKKIQKMFWCTLMAWYILGISLFGMMKMVTN